MQHIPHDGSVPFCPDNVKKYFQNSEYNRESLLQRMKLFESHTSNELRKYKRYGHGFYITHVVGHPGDQMMGPSRDVYGASVESAF